MQKIEINEMVVSTRTLPVNLGKRDRDYNNSPASVPSALVATSHIHVRRRIVFGQVSQAIQCKWWNEQVLSALLLEKSQSYQRKEHSGFFDSRK